MKSKENIQTKVELLAKEYKRLMVGQVDLKKYTNYSISYHSTAIEGSTLSENQVFDLLDCDIPAHNKSFYDHLMVLDHHHALEYVKKQAKAKQLLTMNLVQTIGGMVMKNTGSEHTVAIGSFDSSKGDLRLFAVHAGSRYFPNYQKVPVLLQELINETNEALQNVTTFREKCELAFHLHFCFVSIHPFADGNGRTSRLLMNYILEYFKLPPSFVFKENRTAYINALENARENEDETIFFKFMWKQYEKFLTHEIETIE
ncbi:MAG: Fic family protein [Bacteroidales bacterium]|jgi:Fic family protein|nr:Fic family protein [Bacteroidales bacterium]